MRPISRIAVMALAVGLAALAAGCGGGGKKSPSTQTQTQPTTTRTQGTSTQSPPSGFASAKNCRDFSGLAAKIASAMSATSGSAAASLGTEAKELQALAAAAPSDIRGDFQVFASAFSSYLHALEQAGFKPGSTATPTPAQIAELTKAAKVFESAKLTQAEQHLSAWAARNCT